MYYDDDERERRIPERNFMARYNDNDDDIMDAPPARPPAPGRLVYDYDDRGYDDYDPRGRDPRDQRDPRYDDRGNQYRPNPPVQRGPDIEMEPRFSDYNSPQRPGSRDGAGFNYQQRRPESRDGSSYGYSRPQQSREFDPRDPRYRPEEELGSRERMGGQSRYVDYDPGYVRESELQPYYEETFERGPGSVNHDFSENYRPGTAERFYEDERRNGGSTYAPTYATGELNIDYDEDNDENMRVKISKTSIVVFVYAVVCLFCITQIIMGAVYLYRCPANDYIPEWNLVIAGTTLVIIALIALLHGWERLKRKSSSRSLKPFDDRARSANSLGQFHKMSWLFLSIIQLLAWTSGTIIIARRRPEFELERDDLINDQFEDYDRRQTGLSRFYDAEIMNPDYCDPGIWVFTLVVIIVGWVYLVGLGCVWMYFFCYKRDIRVKEIKPTEVVYLEKQKSQQPQIVNANIYS